MNEIFNEDGTLRSSVFSNVLGQSFVNIAFQAARQADPNAILYINDYKWVFGIVLRACVVLTILCLCYSLDSVNAKVNGLVNLVNSVNSGAKLIDGIGAQMHLSVSTSSPQWESC